MRTLLVAALAVALSACAGAPAVTDAAPAAPAGVPLAAAPEALKDAIARADGAIFELRDRLQARVKAELQAGGPVKAIDVCKGEAPVITAEVAKGRAVELGRTSARLRSPSNAPRPWVKALVAASDGKRASDVAPLLFDLGEKVGVARPIVASGACLACHGTAERLGPGVAQALAAGYPADRATGFAEGDLRGWFWAEVPKRP